MTGLCGTILQVIIKIIGNIHSTLLIKIPQNNSCAMIPGPVIKGKNCNFFGLPYFSSCELPSRREQE
jgi:hypothetical protein